MEIHVDSATDQAILSALRQGDSRQAARLLVERYGSIVYSICSQVVSDREAAEDLTQASFSRAFSEMNTLQGKPSVRQWLQGVLSAVCQERGLAAADPGASGSEAPGGGGAPRRMSESLQRRLEVLASAL